MKEETGEASHRPIESLDLFKLYEEVATWCWESVRNWDSFSRGTIGQQLVRAADSINANLVEGDGRYGGPDAIRFFVIARASARETKLWLSRASARALTDPLAAEDKLEKLMRATKLLNLLINYRRSNPKGNTIREGIQPYADKDPFFIPQYRNTGIP